MFANHAKNYNNKYTRTENDAVALTTTDSFLVDLFATVGALRQKSPAYVTGLFDEALNEDKLLATKIMFYARNVRGGLGERETFRRMLAHLAKTQPEIVLKNLDIIPLFGRYDDLYVLIGTPCENRMWQLLSWTIAKDLVDMNEGKPVTLCAKWLKSVNTSSPESRELGNKTAKAFGMSQKKYRKTLSTLRNYINITETKMSAKKWDEIDYSEVPSRAMKNYRDAFMKHDITGFQGFLDSVEKGEKKINASTLYPYDILMAGHLHYDWASRGDKFTFDNDPVLEAQWKALPNYVKGENNVLVMADTSGSMEGLPMATSIGLSIYFAERNKGAYKDLFMTFSHEPEFIHLKGNTLKEKIQCVKSIVANTDLEKAFDLILDVAIANNVPEEEMPKSLIIISDMQFDSATGGSRATTFHQSMKKKYENAGYKMPTIIYWLVEQRDGGVFQVEQTTQNVILVSGHSTATFKAVLSNIGKNPYEFMVETLSDPIYDVVKV